LVASEYCLNHHELEKVSREIQNHALCKTKLYEAQKINYENLEFKYKTKDMVYSFSFGVIIALVLNEEYQRLKNDNRSD
jgi:hypothetical protein